MSAKRFKLRKGCIFRMLYLNRKNLISAAAVFLVFTVLGLLVRLSMSIGNLARLAGTPEFDDIEKICYYVFTGFPAVIICLLMTDIEVIGKDAQCGWLRFSKTLPMTAGEQAAHIYIIKLAGCAAAFILSLGNLALFDAVSGRSFDPLMFKMIFVITAAGAAFTTVQTTVMIFVRKTNRAAAVTFMMFFVIFLALEGTALLRLVSLMKKMGITPDSGDMDAMFKVFGRELLAFLNAATVAAPIIITASFGAGWFFAKKALERKEG